MKHLRKTSGKAGLSPGTLVHVGEKRSETVRIRLMDYDKEQVREKEIAQIEECIPFKQAPTVTWVNIDGLHDMALLEKIGTLFDIHPLILEDIVHTGTRPKIEDFDHFAFIVFKMLYYDEQTGEILDEQLSIVQGADFVISFQEKEGTVFNPLRNRIRNAKSRIRKKGADYLAYSLIDSVVDTYFGILEKLGAEIDRLDEALFASMSEEMFQEIHEMKRKLIGLRRAVTPLKEILTVIQHADFEGIDESNRIFFKDVTDHVNQIQETVDIYRELVNGLHDTYLTNVNNRMNEIMKTLTITATIFIPLTFIAGIYGMNFKYMPELEWKWGYAAVWAIMIGLFGFMFYHFKKKKWF